MSLKAPTAAGRVLRFLLYLAIGLVVAGLVGITTWYFPSSASRLMDGGWVWLIIFTPIIFWYAARQYRPLWHRPLFWLTLSGLLVLHLLAFILIFRSYSPRPFWLMVIAGIEAGVLVIVLDSILPRPRNRTHRHDTARDP